MLLAAKGRLLEGYVQSGLYILTLGGSVGIPSAAAGEEIAEAAKAAHTAEKISEDIAEIAVVVAGTAGLIEGGMTKLVILGSLLLIGKHSVSFRSLLELFLGFLVSGIHIRMIFLGQLTVSAFQFLIRSRLLNAKYFIIVSFFCHFLLLFCDIQI